MKMNKNISVLVLALSFMTIAHGQTLNVEDVQMEKNTRKKVAIGLNNSSKDQSGIQFDLVLPEGISAAVDEAVLNPNRLADHELHVKQVDDNTYRFLVFSRTNASFMGTRGDLVYVTLVSGDNVSANVMVASIRTALLYATDNSIMDLASVSFNVLITDEQINQSTRTFTANGVSFKMIRVDGGTFTMGATSEQGSDADDREKPAHQVTLSTYYIGETQVTQALWQAVMGQKPTSDGSQWNSTYGLGNNYPAYYVSWDDCWDFIEKLNSITGENFRLPTEAEWEFAARGGNKSRGYKYAGSNTIDNVAWYRSNSNNQTHNVATKAANELGIYDMSGNVFEWCSDWYGSYSSSSQTNPIGPAIGSGRVIRGGDFYDLAEGCRVSRRAYNSPMYRLINMVLRLVVLQAEDVNHVFQCSFLFDTQLHPMPCHLTSIINNPGQFCKIEAAQERGIRHLKTTRNYDGAEQDIPLTTDRENQQDCILGAGNCIIVGTSNYDNILIAYEGQCSNCLELYGGTHYPLSWEENGRHLHCINCGRTYDVNNGTVISGDGRRLYRYQSVFDGQFIRVGN